MKFESPLFETDEASYHEQVMRCFMNLLGGVTEEQEEHSLRDIGRVANDMDDVDALLVSNTASPQFWGVPERGELELEEHVLYWAPEVPSGACYVFGDCQGRLPMQVPDTTPPGSM